MKMIKKSSKEKRVIVFMIILGLFLVTGCSMESGDSQIIQKPLPYNENALEPYISAETMSYHYGKHHAGYVATTNNLLDKSDLKGKSHGEIIRLCFKDKKRYSALFNNAAQAWNHEFFWESMNPSGGGTPDKQLALEFNKAFGSYDQFKETFILEAKQLFGSGWVWLVMDNGGLKIVTTCNADTPLAHGQKPLFTIDVWEHSYYLDHQNNRSEYVRLVLENLIDWGTIAKRIDAK